MKRVIFIWISIQTNEMRRNGYQIRIAKEFPFIRNIPGIIENEMIYVTLTIFCTMII